MDTQEERQAILDDEHLKLLSIGYVIEGAISAFFSVFGLLYAFMGLFIGSVIASSHPSRVRRRRPSSWAGSSGSSG